MIDPVKQYISENQVCPDLIFRNWNEFLDLLFQYGGTVKEILWFEYVSIDSQKDSLGAGGWQDPANPKYMWAETMIRDKGLAQKSLSEIKEHIQKTIIAHQPHSLIPCFFDITA